MADSVKTGEGEVLDVPSHVLEYLSEQETLTLATASPTGVPWATTLTYVSEGPTLYFWTRPDTTTTRHIEANPLVSFAVDKYTADWRQTKGIQGSGECRLVINPEEVRHVVDLFNQKFRSVSAESTANVLFFRITPTELQFIASSGDGREQEQALGIDYPRELVYSVFRDLPEQEVEAVAGDLQTLQVNAGDVVVRQGAPADKFFIIVDGEVEVLREDDGEERKIASLKRGQFFGEMAILRDTPRAATVQAVAPTTLLAMERDAFRGLVAQSLGVTRDFDQIIQKRLAELQR